MFFTFVFAVFWGTGAGVMFAVTPFRGTNCDADPSTFPPAWQNYVSQCEIVVSIQGVAWALCELSAYKITSSYLPLRRGPYGLDARGHDLPRMRNPPAQERLVLRRLSHLLPFPLFSQSKLQSVHPVHHSIILPLSPTFPPHDLTLLRHILV